MGFIWDFAIAIYRESWGEVHYHGPRYRHYIQSHDQYWNTMPIIIKNYWVTYKTPCFQALSRRVRLFRVLLRFLLLLDNENTE
jgi:hypothetical protein